MNTGFNLLSFPSCEFTTRERRELDRLGLSEACANFKRNREEQIKYADAQAEIILRAYERAQANT